MCTCECKLQTARVHGEMEKRGTQGEAVALGEGGKGEERPQRRRQCASADASARWSGEKRGVK